MELDTKTCFHSALGYITAEIQNVYVYSILLLVKSFTVTVTESFSPILYGFYFHPRHLLSPIYLLVKC